MFYSLICKILDRWEDKRLNRMVANMSQI